MPFNIATFSAEMAVGGLARDNKFEVNFGLPAGLAGVAGAAYTIGSRMQFYCEAAALPDVALNAHPHLRYGYGPMELKPNGAKFAPLGLVFRGDKDGYVYRLLTAWQRLACNYEFRNGMDTTSAAGLRPYEIGYKGDYAVNLQVTTFQDNGQPSINVLCREAYPLMVAGEGSSPLAWKHQGDYLRIPALFTYIDWNIIDGAGTAG